MRVAVGLSGGVDSAVAALMLKEQGHDVCGVTMRIWSGDDDRQAMRHACYGPGEENQIRRAREICDVIGIPYSVFDLSDAYEKTVLGYFKREYLGGRTPNPCVLCNQEMKFGLLAALAKEALGSEAFATGHYARTERAAENGRFILRKARCQSKDQSYFIHRLTQDQFRRAIFPLGEYAKEEVRETARREGIPSWSDTESQDFYDGDYRKLIDRDDEPGDIVDAKGAVLGAHRGIWNYTVGQRRGLGIAAAEPLYVTAIDASLRRVFVAPKREAMKETFIATQFNWLSRSGISGPVSLTVKTRSSHRGAYCTVEPLDEGTVRILLENPESGIAAGQSAVLYDGDVVIGGGIIEYE